jgi:anhydro-N-acetylmuramic acid kinase
MAWLDARMDGTDIAPADVQATLVMLSARTVADQCGGLSRLYCCGGGVHNAALMAALRAVLPGCTVADTGTVGIDPDAIEATLFAWLAWQRVHAQAPTGIRTVTGATRGAVLGGVWLPPGQSDGK